MHSAINWKMIYTLVSASHSVHLLRALTLRARLRVCMWTAQSWYRISLVCRLYCDWIQRSHVCLLSVLKTFAREVERLSILKRSPVLLLKKKKDAMGHEQTPGPGRQHRDLKHTGYRDAVLKAFQKVTTCMKCSRYTSHTVSRQTSHAAPIDQSRFPDRPVTLSR